MPRESSPSAGATYLDKAARLNELRAAARRAAARMPHLRRLILFGSLVDGIPTPRSDADLLAVVEESTDPRPRDRIPELLRTLSPLPCPVDLWVLTAAEIDRAIEEGSPLVREAVEKGIDLL
ncbi:MAG: nucleotidyltransferase domain-containing protein [Planctomycetota bacterium]